MKIGAGGLQSLAGHEASRGLDNTRLKPTTGEVLQQSEDHALRRLRYQLNKAVERMRQAALMYNQPLDFAVKREQRPKIQARDRRSGAEREYTLEEAEAWLAELEDNKGRKLNGYA